MTGPSLAVHHSLTGHNTVARILMGVAGGRPGEVEFYRPAPDHFEHSGVLQGLRLFAISYDGQVIL